MPNARPQHDPFTDAPLRPTTGNATSLAAPAHPLRGQPSQHSLRSNASTASSRSRQQGNLFAPTLSRRPTSRATPSFDDDVLADEEDEEELAAAQQQQRRGGLRHARLKHGSPESKHARLQKSKQEAEVDFVVRRSDGGYLNEIPEMDAVLAQHAMVPEMRDEAEIKEMDAMHSATVKSYLTMSPSSGSRTSDKYEQARAAFEDTAPAISARLREQVLAKLEDERWKWEPTTRAY